MIIVDTALKKRYEESNPVRVAVIGAGYMGRGVVLQVVTAVPGMEVVAVYNRTLATAGKAYEQAGISDVESVSSVGQLEDAIKKGRYTITDDPMLVCQAEGIDVVIEVTGEVEFGAHVVLEAIKHKKHVVLMNAELDAVVGPILKVYADREGVVLTNADGDQPGVIMNLYRYVKMIGCKPVLCGNIKGLQDPYRTPETQRAYAEQYKQKTQMVTSFADGTKISMEMAVVANATGFKVGQRGMTGYKCDHVDDTLDLYPVDELLKKGWVDYILGAKPPGGIFVLAYHDNPIQQQYMNYYKLGNGPLYVFYNPYHVCHLEVPITAARAELFHDAAIAPIGGPLVDVVATAKRDLKAGETLDSIGGFMAYGQAENYDMSKAENLMPISLLEGCIVKHDISKDTVLTYADVEVPEGRLVDKLRLEQDEYFN